MELHADGPSLLRPGAGGMCGADSNWRAHAGSAADAQRAGRRAAHQNHSPRSEANLHPIDPDLSLDEVVESVIPTDSTSGDNLCNVKPSNFRSSPLSPP